MPLVSVSCPECGASTYVSLPAGHRFVTAEPETGDNSGPPNQETSEVTCDGCQAAFPVVHAPT